jgi:hypothetical protein
MCGLTHLLPLDFCKTPCGAFARSRRISIHKGEKIRSNVTLAPEYRKGFPSGTAAGVRISVNH